jgi:O-antigen ligase
LIAPLAWCCAGAPAEASILRVAPALLLGLAVTVRILSRQAQPPSGSWSPLRLTVPDGLFICHIGFAALSVLAAKDRAAALSQLAGYAPLALALYGTARLVWCDRVAAWVVPVWVTLAAAVAIVGVLEAVAGHSPVYPRLVDDPYYERYRAEGRIMATFLHPVVAGAFFTTMLPLAFGCVHRAARPLTRALAWAGLIAQAAALILTFTRAAWAAALAAAVVLGPRRLGRGGFAVFGGALIALLAAPAVAPEGSPLRARLSAHALANNPRLARIPTTFRMMRTSPLIGVGLGQYRPRFAEFDRANEATPFEFQVADDMYLTLLAETGVLGLGSFLAFTAVLIVRLWKWRRAAPGDDDPVPLLGALVAALVTMVGYEALEWGRMAVLFWILAGACAAAGAMSRKSRI